MTERLWMALVPNPTSTRLLLTDGPMTTLLKARLSPQPAHPRALPTLLEALALWQNRPVHAVLGVDATSPSWVSVSDPGPAGVADSPLYRLDYAWRGPHRHDRISGFGDCRDLYQLLIREVAR